jgi:hypothetical protein
VAYWIAIDEDTDVSDVVQPTVFIRGVNEDCQLSVELLDLDPMKGEAGGEELVLNNTQVLRRRKTGLLMRGIRLWLAEVILLQQIKKKW